MTMELHKYYRQLKISEHITYLEAIRSQTATRFGINNQPNDDQLEAMRWVGLRVFDVVRNYFNVPIMVSSFFRSPELNQKIGGSTTSQHCLGEAIDIDDTYGGVTNAEIFHFIKDNLEFDQLIWEFGDDVNPDWVHVSLKKKGGNRNQILKAYRENGRVKYELWT